jgi:hypothetical protein
MSYTYAQLFHMSLPIGGPSHPIPICGNDGVIVLDGRLSFSNQLQAIHKAIARSVKGSYVVGFQLHKGTFMRSTPIGQYQAV